MTLYGLVHLNSKCKNTIEICEDDIVYRGLNFHKVITG